MENEKNYLEYLAELYPTIEKAATEIINLQSVINLPKGTEHFLSDIHGEYEAFSHVLRNGSGAVRKKIDDVFGHTLGISEKRALATLIYYPRERLEMEKKQQEDIDDWYKVMLYRLIDVCKIVSSKYTRAKVRKALPADYGYIIEELITEKPEVLDKEAYYEAIIQTILEIGSAENFIIAVAELIQRLVVDHLHIIGDIFDRGPEPYKIMDCLMNYHPSISSGATTMCSGWALRPASRRAWPARSASASTTAISMCWRTATASICFRLPPLLSRRTAMIRANALPQKAARTAEIPSRCWSAACTRPSP